ncbi:MAG: gliding motility-associated C-terminal domain-containing protein, partial [Saprospiraceae bacterium]|nr:gliding motility-associated C-terminal domain-containing protein [Saprospiraceae bacterium]
SAPYTYRWNDRNPPSTTRLINNLAQGRYTVVVTDANGCQVTGSVEVTADDRECFTGRLVITPNGDGRNDAFAIACNSSFDNEILIFDRHGELVFSMDNYDNSWQGMENDGDMLPDGGYFWVLRVRTPEGMEQYTGHVTILRSLN